MSQPQFLPAFTEGISNILAQTEYPGFSGSELRRLLHIQNLELAAGPNKRESLFLTLHNRQVTAGTGGSVVKFINSAMEPSRHVKDEKRFDLLQGELNAFLVLHGFKVTDAGRIAKSAQKASTLTEAARLAGQLHTELQRRGVHAELLRYCDEELVRRSLFHAMTEASKSIAARIREISSLAGDGATLYDGVFGSGSAANPPLYLINAHATDSDLSEHKGFKNLLVGIHGHYRNPRAHSSRIDNTENLADFYDAFALFSYVHRRLDGLVKKNR